MKNKFLSSIILLFILMGCAKESSIVLHNDAPHMVTVKVDGEVYPMLQNCEPVEIPYYLNSYLLLGETVKVPVTYVERLYIAPQEFTVRLKPNQNKHLHIVQDRAAFQIINLSTVSIAKVLMRKDSLSAWSENLYEGYLAPEEIDYFAVFPDYTQFRIIDVYEVEYSAENVVLEAGQLTEYVFYGVLNK